MKQSPLRDAYSVRAELAPFMGMELPRMFTTVEDEVLAAIGSVALVDRSFYGRIRVTGADRVDLLHRISTNDLTGLRPGNAVPTIFTNEKGRLIDYVWIVALEKELIIISSPGREQALIAWIDKYTISEDIQLENMSSSTAMLTLIGPRALMIGREHGMLPSEYRVQPLTSAATYVSRDFYTLSVTMLGPIDQVASVWTRLQTVTRPMGSEALDTFRISRGVPLPEHEISERFNPYDIALTHAISYTKGCYIGQEVIARLDTYQKSRRTLAGIRLRYRPEGIGNYAEILYGSEQCGVLTSLSSHAVRNSYIGAAVVNKDMLKPGIQVSVKGVEHVGELQEFPLLFDHSGDVT